MGGTTFATHPEADAVGAADTASRRRSLRSAVWAVLAAALGLATLVLRALAAIRMRGPVVNGDEGGYLTKARFLADDAPTAAGNYFPGYSAVISPVFRIGSLDPVGQYRGVLVVNLLLAVIGAGACYLLLRFLSPATGRPARALVAVTVASLPSWLGFASLAMAENLLNPAFLIALLLVAAAVTRWRGSALGAAGLAAGLLYAIHPRAAAIALALTVCAAIVVRQRPERLRPALMLGTGVVAGALLGRSFANWVARRSATGSYGTGRLAERLTDLHALADVPGTVAGHLGYLIVAGSVFYVAGLIVGGRSTLRLITGSSDTGDFLRAMVFVAHALTLALSVSYWIGEDGRADAPIYGRYMEPVAILVVTVGIAAILDRARDRRRRDALLLGAGSLAALGVLLACARVTLGAAQFRGTAVQANVIAVKFAMPPGEIALNRMFAIGAVGIAVVAVLIAADARAALAAAAVVGLGLQVTQIGPSWVQQSASRARQHQVPDAVVAFVGNDPCVALDRRTFSGWHYFGYAFFLDGNPIVRFTADEQAPCGPLIVSGEQDIPTLYPGARLMALENDVDQQLWVLPQLQPLVGDRLFPGLATERLPDSARHADVQWVGPSALRPGQAMRVQVTHTGTGSPWASRLGVRGAPGFVDVRAQWYLMDGGDPVARTAIDLPVMYPGDTLIVEGKVPDDGSLRPGSYRLELAVVQEGITELTTTGTAEVEVRIG